MLKAGSKQASGAKKRKKVPLLGTFAQFNESKKKPVAPPEQKPAEDQPMDGQQPPDNLKGKEDLRKKK